MHMDGHFIPSHQYFVVKYLVPLNWPHSRNGGVQMEVQPGGVVWVVLPLCRRRKSESNDGKRQCGGRGDVHVEGSIEGKDER